MAVHAGSSVDEQAHACSYDVYRTLLAEVTNTSCNVHAQGCALLDVVYALAQRNQECYRELEAAVVTRLHYQFSKCADQLNNVLTFAVCMYSSLHDHSWKGKLCALGEVSVQLDRMDTLLSNYEQDVWENEQMCED